MLASDLENGILKIEGKYCFLELAILIKKMTAILQVENKNINDETIFKTAMTAFEHEGLDANELLETDIYAKSKSKFCTEKSKKMVVSFEVDDND